MTEKSALTIQALPKDGNDKGVVDLIAVQGLGSNPARTWTKESVLWLRDLLPKYIDARIATYSYPSDPWRASKKTTLRECGEQFLNHILQFRATVDEKKRPLLLVGHSMGGLVVKQALVIANHGTLYKEVKSAITGILFLGTPHQGSNLADFAASLLAPLQQLTSLVNAELLNNLRKDAPQLFDMSRDFWAEYADLDIVCFYEKDKRKGLISDTLVVTPQSSSLLGKRMIFLETDHSGMNKFTGAEDPNFKLIKNEIVRLVGAGLKATLSWRKDIEAEEKAEAILAWISNVPYMDHHTYAHKLRLEGTGEWLLRKPKFDQWYRAEESSVLWLCGGIGVGKTILVSKVVDHFLSNACYGQSLAYFYCQRGTNEPKRSIPSEILCSIVKQLAFNETTQTLIKPVGNSYDERAKKGFARGSFDIEESTDLILKMSELIPSMIIVIDALDEVDPDRRHELLQAFENICSTASNPVKLFVSSRNDTDIRTMLEGSLNLFIDATDSCGDIETFVVKEVKTVIKRKRLIGGKVSPELENLVVQTLIGRAEGMFRWVQLQIELICNAKHIKRDPDVRSALGKLPATLKESYEQIYSQILELEPPSRVIAERVLSWLLCAKRLLSVHELLAAICVGWDEKPDPVEESDLLDLCFNLVVTDKSSDSFRLAHLSVREYLEMRPEFTTLNTNILAAERCVTTWRMKFPHNDRFYTYSSFYMLEHYPNEDQLSDRLKDFLFSSINNPTSAFKNWCQAARFARNMLNSGAISSIYAETSPLPFIACYYGMPSLLASVIESNSEACHKWNQNGKSILQVACRRNHIECVKLVLKNFPEFPRQDSLAEAVSNGHEDIVHLLLDNVPKLKGNIVPHQLVGPDIIRKAERNGPLSILRLLLERDAQVDALCQSSSEHSVICAAASRKAEASVQLLLEKWPNCLAHENYVGFLQATQRKKEKETPANFLESLRVRYDLLHEVPSPKESDKTVVDHTALHAACRRRGNEKVVRLLINKGGADVNARGVRASTPLTPLREAIYVAKDATLVKILLDSGAKVDTSEKWTFNDQIEESSDKQDIIQLLKVKGAKVEIVPLETDLLRKSIFNVEDTNSFSGSAPRLGGISRDIEAPWARKDATQIDVLHGSRLWDIIRGAIGDESRW